MDSNLQIISGAFRGRKLAIAPGTRPTQNRARIALFNVLRSMFGDSGVCHTPLLTTDVPAPGSPRNRRLSGADQAGMTKQQLTTVWDAFGGSGAIGLEFLSRGWAARAIFTDSDAAAIKTIRINARDIPGAEVIMADAMTMIKKFAPHVDLVFIDPPYSDSNLGEKFIAEFVRHARMGTIVVWERETDKNFKVQNAKFDHLETIKHKKYGRAEFWVMRIGS